MGMFDKDKEIGRELTAEFKERDQFILYAVKIADEQVETSLGMADKSLLTVSTMSDPNERFEVTSLGSAIANKVREADASDFPAVVQWLTVDSKKYGAKATVIQFVRPL